jgi:hypothetical protein
VTAVNEALRLIEDACTAAEDQQGGGDTYRALATLATMAGDIITVLAPYAERMPSVPRTIILLSSGSTLQVPTSVNTAADIAGLMNAGTPKVYSAVDLADGFTHNILVSTIVDVYQVP